MAVVDNNIIPFTQDEIEKVVREIYRNNGVTDISYEGSNVSQLASVMSYVISTLNTNTAANLPEVLLPLATKLKPAQYGARHVGYEPHRKISYQYELGIFSVFDADKVGETIDYSIPRNTSFQSGSNTYHYLGADVVGSYVSPASEGDVSLQETLIVREGSFQFFSDPNNPVLTHIANEEYNSNDELTVKQDYLVPFDDVEQNGLQVFLSYTDPEKGIVTKELWTQSDIFIVDSTFDQLQNSYVVANNIYLNQPTIKFQIGKYGQGVVRGSIIEINALISSGSEGTADGSFTFQDGNIQAVLNPVDITLITRGLNEESIEDIKENAPLFNNTANRAVTRLDYIALSQKHSAVNKAECWGGEEVTLDNENFQIRAYRAQGTPVVGTPPVVDEQISAGWVEVTLKGTENPWNSSNTYTTGDEVYYAVPQADKLALGAVWLSATPEITELSYTADNPLINSVYTADKLTDLSNWYLREGSNAGGEIYKPLVSGSNDGLMSFLDPYKVMTLELTHRQPAYMDFEYAVNIIKYNAVKLARDSNKEIFDIMSNYFDSNIRNFSTDHIMSNLIRRIDDLLTDISGVEIGLKTSLSFTDSPGFLHSQENPDRYIADHANPENVNITAIRTYLAFPFSSMYDTNNDLEISKIPRVDTTSYGPGGNLVMDVSGTTIPYSDKIEIRLLRSSDNAQIGEYIINNELGHIEIVLWDVTANCSMVGNIGKLDVIYSDNLNFPVTKNVMPRLRTVTFN